MKRGVRHPGFLGQVFGFDGDLVRAVIEKYDDSASDEGRGPPEYALSDMARILECTQAEAARRAFRSDDAMRSVFGIPMWRDGPGDAERRAEGRFAISDVVGEFVGYDRACPMSAEVQSNASPEVDTEGVDAAVIGRIVADAKAGRDRHYLWRSEADATEEERWASVASIHARIAHVAGEGRTWLLHRSSSRSVHRSRPGFDALASALLDDPCAIRVFPDVNILLGGPSCLPSWINDGRVHRLPPTIHGMDRIAAVRRYVTLMRRLQGVHVWCAPSGAVPPEGAPSRSGACFLPDLDGADGRRCVLRPLILMQDALRSNSDAWSRDQEDEYERDTRLLQDIVSGATMDDDHGSDGPGAI